MQSRKCRSDVFLNTQLNDNILYIKAKKKKKVKYIVTNTFSLILEVKENNNAILVFFLK